MKTLRTILASTILILAVSICAYGNSGDVNTPANKPPATCTTCAEAQPVDVTITDNNLTNVSSAQLFSETSNFAADILLALLSFF